MIYTSGTLNSKEKDEKVIGAHFIISKSFYLDNKHKIYMNVLEKIDGKKFYLNYELMKNHKEALKLKPFQSSKL